VSTNIIRAKLELSTQGETRDYLVGEPEKKIPLARPRRRWEDSIKSSLNEIRWKIWVGFKWLMIRITFVIFSTQ
jgi:hypothetical protein